MGPLLYKKMDSWVSFDLTGLTGNRALHFCRIDRLAVSDLLKMNDSSPSILNSAHFRFRSLYFSVFANKVHPNIAGATVQGIFMTMPLGFDVRCFYDDNFDLTIDDIYIDSDQVDMGDEDGAIEGDGDVSIFQKQCNRF